MAKIAVKTLSECKKIPYNIVVEGICKVFVIYLPIAKITVNIFYLIIVGIVGGFVPGVFGVGGGFLTVPLMLFVGIKSPIAIFSANTQIIYSSITAVMNSLRSTQKNIDLQIGSILSCGLFIGFLLGEKFMNFMIQLGYMDIFIPFLYIIILGSIGSFMFWESVKSLYKKYTKVPIQKKHGKLDDLLKKLPLKIHNQIIKDNYSILIPFIAAICGGILMTAGMSTGFIVYPILIYVLRLPALYIMNTNLFSSLFTLCYLVGYGILKSERFDLLLSIVLIFSSIVGNVLGVKISKKIQPEELRVGLSCLMLIIVIKFIISLIKEPANLFTIG